MRVFLTGCIGVSVPLPNVLWCTLDLSHVEPPVLSVVVCMCHYSLALRE